MPTRKPATGDLTPDTTSTGRMISAEIADSEKFASLSPNSMVLFTLLIPHWSAHGKMRGDLHFVKEEVCPLIGWFDEPMIKTCLREITQKTNVKWFQHRKRHYLHSLSFFEHNPRLRVVRKGRDQLPGFPECQHNPENAWITANSELLLEPVVPKPAVPFSDVRAKLQSPSTTLHALQKPPSTSTSPLTSTSEGPINILTTTRARENDDDDETRSAPVLEKLSATVATYPLTAEALAGIIPDVDDEAIAALVIACRVLECHASDEEIAFALERKFTRAKQLKTRNLAGFLIVAVPKCFVGRGYQNLRRSLARSKQEALAATEERADYLRCAAGELEKFVEGTAPRATAETWLPYLESRMRSGDVYLDDIPWLNTLCAQARQLLAETAPPKVCAARGP